MTHQPRPDPAEPAPVEVVDDHAQPRDPTHLAEQEDRLVGRKVVEDHRGVDHVERAVGVGERAPVADMELQARRRGHGRSGHDGRREDLGPAVDADDGKPAPAFVRPREERHRDVGAAGPDIEHGQLLAMRGQRIDRVGAQPDPAEPSVDPAQVAQVPGQGRRVVQRPVEQLDGIDAALHRCSVRRARTMGRMIVVAGEALIDILVHPDGRLAAVPGGGPFNTARTIGRLGGQVAFLGRLSTDRFGGDPARRAGRVDGVDLSLAEADGRADHPRDRRDRRRRGRDATASTRPRRPPPSCRSTRSSAALATRPRAVHLGTLGLVLEPVGRGAGRPRSRRSASRRWSCSIRTAGRG